MPYMIPLSKLLPTQRRGVQPKAESWFREAMRYCGHAALAGAIFVQSTWACIDWEYHERVINSYRDVNGCLITNYESWEEGWNSSTYTVIVQNQNYWSSDPEDCPPEEESCYGAEECQDCPELEGANPFRPFDGNVSRTVRDLLVAGAARRDFGWTRHHNTVPVTDLCYFGRAGGWRHNWQFDLFELSSAGRRKLGEERTGLVFIYPNGISRIFRPHADGTWRSSSADVQETLHETSGGFEVKTGEDVRLAFVQKSGGQGLPRYEMVRMTERNGAVTSLSYGVTGYMTRVQEPGGRTLDVSYRQVPFGKGVWHMIGAVTGAASAGAWVEFDAPAGLREKAFRHLRVRSAQDGAPVAVAEVQFIAADGTLLAGAANGTGEAPSAAFDGNPATTFKGSRSSINVLGIDLGERREKSVAKVRLLPMATAPLADALIEGLELIPASREVVTKVEASDGRSVAYGYELIKNPVTAHDYIALTSVQYGDGANARYKYETITATERPLLVEADDPRYELPAKRIRYAYYDKLGMIHREINPATGGVYNSLELDPANPDKRLIVYSDLRTVTYIMPAALRGQPTERIDGIGRRETFEYANNGTGRLVAAVEASGDRVEYAYGANGKLAERRRNGRLEHRVEYDEAGRVLRQTGGDGRQTVYSRDGSGRVVKLTAPDGISRSWKYDGAGRVTEFRDKTGGAHTFTYDSRGLRTEWRNPESGVTKLRYDRHDRLIEVTDPVGRSFKKEYNERGLVTQIVFPDRTTKRFEFDTYGRPVALTDRDGRTARLAYDEMSRVVQRTDPTGGVTQFDYSDLPQGCGSCSTTTRPSRIIAPDGRIISILFDGEGRVLAQTVAEGTPQQATTTFEYDARNNIVAATDPLGRVTRYTFDGRGNRISATDPLGRSTRWTYDAEDNPVAITSAAGGVTELEYDANGRVTARKNPAGAVTRYAYDDVGNLVRRTDPSGKVTDYAYRGKRRTAVVHPDGKTESWTYDVVGRVAKAKTIDGMETELVYDDGDRVTRARAASPAGKVTVVQHRYDAAGRRVGSKKDSGPEQQWSYDALGNATLEMAPDGGRTWRSYDARGRLVSVIDRGGNTSTYNYDEFGDMVRFVDAGGNAYAFAYDALHRKVGLTYPDGTMERWGYSLGGELISYTNRSGQTKAIAYNLASQPISETWTEAAGAADAPVLPPAVHYTYDDSGRLATLDNGHAKLSYTYDNLSRMASETMDLSSIIAGGPKQTIGYGYDEFSRLARVQYPDDTTVHRDYDSSDRLTSVRAGGRELGSYRYTSAGNVAEIKRANGIATSHDYTPAGILAGVTHASEGRILAAVSYDHDVNGRRAEASREDGANESHSYDASGNLSGVQRSDSRASETFHYDGMGNRVRSTQAQRGGESASQAARDTDYITNSLNQYIKTGASSLTYDRNGNLTRDASQSYRYDGQNRLVEVESATTKSVFRYDARNRCVARLVYANADAAWKLDESRSRALTYDHRWSLLAERSLDGKHNATYVPGAAFDEILAVRDSESWKYPLRDGIGSTIAVTNAAGGIVSRFQYDAFGRPHASDAAQRPAKIAATGFRFLFTGREWIEDHGLSDHRHRYLRPEHGRWLTPDPIGFDGGQNLYAYAANDPVNLADPMGQTPFAGAVAGAQIGTAVLPGVGTVIGTLIGAGVGYIVIRWGVSKVCSYSVSGSHVTTVGKCQIFDIDTSGPFVGCLYRCANGQIVRGEYGSSNGQISGCASEIDDPT